MDLLKTILDFFLHLDQYLHTMILNYGYWIYFILFIIIFVETGLVIMPFLPGDSLLFAAGALCAGVVGPIKETANLNLYLVLFLLSMAAILGDSLNYYFGKRVGLRILKWKIRNKQLVKENYINKTHQFFEEHGPKTIIIARFVPIIRTFAPFVAGIGSMDYKTFIRYNIIGGLIWVCSLVLLGYFFGNLSFVRNNFETVIFGIIGLSLLPMVWEYFKVKVFTKEKSNIQK